MEVALYESVLQAGVLGAVCVFFMWKDIRKDSKIVASIERIATIIDERIPKRPLPGLQG